MGDEPRNYGYVAIPGGADALFRRPSLEAANRRHVRERTRLFGLVFTSGGMKTGAPSHGGAPGLVALAGFYLSIGSRLGQHILLPREMISKALP